MSCQNFRFARSLPLTTTGETVSMSLINKSQIGVPHRQLCGKGWLVDAAPAITYLALADRHSQQCPGFLQRKHRTISSSTAFVAELYSPTCLGFEFVQLGPCLWLGTGFRTLGRELDAFFSFLNALLSFMALFIFFSSSESRSHSQVAQQYNILLYPSHIFLPIIYVYSFALMLSYLH